MDNQTNNETQNEEVQERLYAGKFKTVEALEEGYKNSFPTFQENEKLKTQLKELTELPTDYLQPSDVSLGEDKIKLLKGYAKSCGMTQQQYDRLVASEFQQLEANKNHYQEREKSVGEEKLNLIKDYVAKHYPKELQETVLKKAITDDVALAAVMSHRNQLLNSNVQGISSIAVSTHTVSQGDIDAAYARKEKSRSTKDIDAYVNLVSARAKQMTGA